MSEQEQAIRQFRQKLGLLLILRKGLAFLTLGVFIYGALTLILRGTLAIENTWLLWGLLSLILTILPAIWIGRRMVPNPTQIRALIDEQNHYGGVLMAAENKNVDRWNRSLKQPQVPELRWRSGPSWVLLLLGVVFLGGTFLLPQSYFRALGSEPRLQIDREVADLNRKIDVLKEEKILEKDRAKELQQRLDQLKKDSSGTDPTKTLSSLEHIEKVTRGEAEKAAEKLRQEIEKLARAEAVAKALKKEVDRLRKKKKEQSANGQGGEAEKKENEEHAKALSRAQKEFAKMMEKLREENPDLDQQLQKMLDQQAQKALDKALQQQDLQNVSTEQLKKLAEALKNLQKTDLGKIERLEMADLVDPAEGDKGGKGKIDADKLAQMMAGNKDGKMTLQQMVQQAQPMPGKGGRNRGRGDAALTFGDKTKEKKAQQKDNALPLAKLQDFRNSDLMGLSKSVPKPKTEGGQPGSGALSGSKGREGAAIRHVILPRHRQAIRRYNERKSKP